MPNYMAAVGGDYFGLNHDYFGHNHNHGAELPRNVSTIVDLLEDAGISWGVYQESMPYTGFTESSYRNPETQASMYVRKHNPVILYGSVAQREERLACIKNMTLFREDLERRRLPQWVRTTFDRRDWRKADAPPPDVYLAKHDL